MMMISLVISTLMFLLILGIMTYILFRYNQTRRRSEELRRIASSVHPRGKDLPGEPSGMGSMAYDDLARWNEYERSVRDYRRSIEDQMKLMGSEDLSPEEREARMKMILEHKHNIKVSERRIKEAREYYYKDQKVNT